MKEKDIAQQLGAMINQQQMYSSNISVDDSIPAELDDPDPVFTMDYDSELTQCIESAYETVKIIVNSVVPKQFQNNDLLRNKMRLDAHQLGMLYYQQRTTNVALKRVMDIIATGCTDPKIFAIIEKYQKVLAEISSQITETQNSFRKYYIDSYLDLEEKGRVDEIAEAGPRKGLSSRPAQRMIEVNDNGESVPEQAEKTHVIGGLVTDDGGVRFSGSREAVKSLIELKKERFRKAKAETVDFSEA